MVGKLWHHLEHHLARPRADADSSSHIGLRKQPPPNTLLARRALRALPPATLPLSVFILHRCPGSSSRALHFVGSPHRFSCHGLPFESRRRPDVAPSGIRFTFTLPDLVSSGNHKHLNSNCPVLPRTFLHAIAVVAFAICPDSHLQTFHRSRDDRMAFGFCCTMTLTSPPCHWSS